jgi:hypothetical protein
LIGWSGFQVKGPGNNLWSRMKENIKSSNKITAIFIGGNLKYNCAERMPRQRFRFRLRNPLNRRGNWMHCHFWQYQTLYFARSFIHEFHTVFRINSYWFPKHSWSLSWRNSVFPVA